MPEAWVKFSSRIVVDDRQPGKISMAEHCTNLHVIYTHVPMLYPSCVRSGQPA